jgi:HlyD family secretion protein
MNARPLRRLLALLVVLGAGVAAWRVFRKPEPKTRFVTAQVSRRDITAVVNATGPLDPIVKVLVGSQVSGRIQKLSADYNDRVKKDQVLAQIEPSSFRARAEQADAQLVKARAALADAQRTSRRSEDLFRSKIGAQADLDAARTKVQLADGDVKQAAANLNQARVDLENTRILSPIDGVVISRNVEEGQTVAASLSAPTLFTIADDLSKLQIVANVDEADIGQVVEGQKVSFTVDAFPQSSFKGVVKLIRNSPVNVQGVITYETIVEVENPEQRLRPGMTANVAVVVAKKTGVLALPNAALRYRPPESAAKRASDGDDAPSTEKKKGKKPKSHVTVWRLKDGELHGEKAKIGITDGSYTEIKEGLAENDLVVVGTQAAEAGGRSGKTPLTPSRPKSLP